MEKKQTLYYYYCRYLSIAIFCMVLIVIKKSGQQFKNTMKYASYTLREYLIMMSNRTLYNKIFTYSCIIFNS